MSLAFEKQTSILDWLSVVAVFFQEDDNHG